MDTQQKLYDVLHYQKVAQHTYDVYYHNEYIGTVIGDESRWHARPYPAVFHTRHEAGEYLLRCSRKGGE